MLMVGVLEKNRRRKDMVREEGKAEGKRAGGRSYLYVRAQRFGLGKGLASKGKRGEWTNWCGWR